MGLSTRVDARIKEEARHSIRERALLCGEAARWPQRCREEGPDTPCRVIHINNLLPVHKPVRFPLFQPPATEDDDPMATDVRSAEEDPEDSPEWTEVACGARSSPIDDSVRDDPAAISWSQELKAPLVTSGPPGARPVTGPMGPQEKSQRTP